MPELQTHVTCGSPECSKCENHTGNTTHGFIAHCLGNQPSCVKGFGFVDFHSVSRVSNEEEKFLLVVDCLHLLSTLLIGKSGPCNWAPINWVTNCSVPLNPRGGNHVSTLITVGLILDLVFVYGSVRG